jgi:shikimate kinase
LKIFLIGFMGAGKSTVGKKLAERMRFRFIDVDDYIEEKEKMSIPSIFEKKGERYFRLLEHNILLEISGLNESLIVSTGGGAPCFMNNMELLNSSGITIYLKLDAPAIFHRLTNAEKKNRPLIENKTPEELLQYIFDKLKEREPVYNKSRLVVAGENIKIHVLGKKIKSLIADSQPLPDKPGM